MPPLETRPALRRAEQIDGHVEQMPIERDRFPSRRMPREVRSLFVSDVHLGCKHSQAEEFLTFLRSVRPEYLYLVGDMIDGWKLKRRWRWLPVYDGILKHLLSLRQSGTRILYTPGNHDAFLRSFLQHVGGVRVLEICDQFVHTTADGRRFLVTHGDQFDHVERHAAWLSKLSSIGYDVLLSTNRVVNHVRGKRHNPYAFCNAVKRHVKRLVQHVSRFEERLVGTAKAHNCHGVICGHIHVPRILDLGNLYYCNTGDWVENCSALLEFSDGTFELIRGDGTLVDRLPAGNQQAGACQAGNCNRVALQARMTAAPVENIVLPAESVEDALVA